MSAAGRTERALDAIRLLTARGVYLCACNMRVYAAAPECEDPDEIEELIAPFRWEMVALLPLGHPWDPRPLRWNVEIAVARMGSPVYGGDVAVRVSTYRPAEPPGGSR